jgi:glycosyltransferase involved in cell wall biosynthesis
VSAIPSLHVAGSKAMGGAERWFLRFLRAMRHQGQPVQAIVRRGSELSRQLVQEIPFQESPMRTVWDPWSRHHLGRLVRASSAPIVQTYMGRATRLLRLPPGGAQVHIARLGGYYKVDPFRRAHAWIGNTRGLCDWLVQQGLPADRVFHIYNFADPPGDPDPDALAARRAEIAARPDDLLLLTAGRLIDVKGHRFLIDALARLPAEIDGRRLRLLLLGSGPLLPALQAQARQAGVDGRIVWLGWRDDPAPWYALADMVVFPSRDAETLGNVVLEAWAYGKPLVTSAFRGAREIARHGQDAWVVPCDDGAALADGITQLLRDTALQQAMATQGRRRVAADFAEATIIGQYNALYRQLADRA